MDVMSRRKCGDSCVDAQRQRPCNPPAWQRIVNGSGQKVSAALDILRWPLRTQTEIVITNNTT